MGAPGTSNRPTSTSRAATAELNKPPRRKGRGEGPVRARGTDSIERESPGMGGAPRRPAAMAAVPSSLLLFAVLFGESLCLRAPAHQSDFAVPVSAFLRYPFAEWIPGAFLVSVAKWAGRRCTETARRRCTGTRRSSTATATASSPYRRRTAVRPLCPLLHYGSVHAAPVILALKCCPCIGSIPGSRIWIWPVQRQRGFHQWRHRQQVQTCKAPTQTSLHC